LEEPSKEHRFAYKVSQLLDIEPYCRIDRKKMSKSSHIKSANCWIGERRGTDVVAVEEAGERTLGGAVSRGCERQFSPKSVYWFYDCCIASPPAGYHPWIECFHRYRWQSLIFVVDGAHLRHRQRHQTLPPVKTRNMAR
jgi:hypothetical protein